MQFDLNRNKPTPGSTGECPCCKTKLVAKCGDIKIWHWAHESLKECDSWYEPMTQWHIDWQNCVPDELQEIIIGHHIADIKLPNGKVIEIQHSNIPVEVVLERESFYENMTWIFDGSEFKDRFIIKYKYDENDQFIYNTFKFKRPRSYIVHCTKFPLYIDFGDYIFEVKKFKSWQNKGEYFGVEREYTSWSGWGYKREKDVRLYRSIFGKFYKGTTS